MFGTRTREDAAASAEVLGKLAALTRNEVGHLPADMVLTMAPGEPATLAVTDGTHRVEVAGETPQAALNRPTDEELARRALEKCGGTPFTLQKLTCHIAPGLMLPLSALNRLRAAALTALAEARSVTVPYPQAPAPADDPRRQAGGRPADPAAGGAGRETRPAGGLRPPAGCRAADILCAAAGGDGNADAAAAEGAGADPCPLRQPGRPADGPGGRAADHRRLRAEYYQFPGGTAGGGAGLRGTYPFL